LQRLIAAHEEVATVSEPWLLLPLLYTLKRSGIYSEYGHKILVAAVEDLCNELPSGKDDYYDCIRSFALDIYKKASAGSARYFLDKTPRYHLIVDDLVSLFPNAKFIILWRNPLAVVSSIIETWGGGNWNLYRFKVDLFAGLTRLVSAFESYPDLFLSLRYEDVVNNAEVELMRVFDFLELEFDTSTIERFTDVELRGRMGDKGAHHTYNKVTSELVSRWKETIRSPVRKEWCRRYLKWIGRRRLEIMGYDLDNLLKELDGVRKSNKSVISDLYRICYGSLYCTLETNIVWDKLFERKKWHDILSHM
jgi:hypothetical protein